MHINIKTIIIIGAVASIVLVMMGAGLFLESGRVTTHELQLFNVTKGMNTHTDITTNNVCGTDNLGDVRTDYLKVNVDSSGNEDPVTVKYTIHDCSTHTVDIDIYINGELASSKTKTKDSATHLFGGLDIDVNDDIKAVVKYTLT